MRYVWSLCYFLGTCKRHQLNGIDCNVPLIVSPLCCFNDDLKMMKSKDLKQRFTQYKEYFQKSKQVLNNVFTFDWESNGRLTPDK